MSKKRLIITIDGPAGAGKSSVSKAVAQALGYTYIDTGAMFRATALAAQRRGVDWSDEKGLAELLDQIEIGFRRVDGEDHVTLDGEDVEAEIRTDAISQGASAVALLPAVRARLLAQQRALGAAGGVILEGRDTGSVVFPHADLKIYLDASVEQRARRRMLQLGRDDPETFEALKASIAARDAQDSQRDTAPLICPADAHRVDTTNRSFEEVVADILQRANALI